MSETTQWLHCGKCGGALSGYAPEGLCAACLLESALENPAAETREPSEPASLLAFDDYELLEEIARGGMGVVYRARQVSLDRPVAIKMILGGHLANAAETQRFRAEAETAAQLQHPNIVAIHEVGEHAGQPFFSMDLIEGRNLAQLVRDEPLPSRKAATYLKTIAEAVHYAHSRGVLHRDLKPSNILIDENDQPRITDFGLAKRLTSTQDSGLKTQDLTQTGQVLGSPSFIPPEQAAGKHRDLTPASDVYSLGAILCHCLTGRPPFVAETLAQTLRMVAEQEPVSPRLLNASVPCDLETICLKCLEKDPRRRYATAQELADELDRFLRNEPIHARPAGLVLKTHRWCVRNKPLAIAGTAILALLLVVAIGSPIALVRIDAERKRAEKNAKQEEKQRLRAEANAKQASSEAIRSQQVSKVLQEMLLSAGPSVARGRDATLLRELLAKIAVRLDNELGDQPEVRGDIYFTLGKTYLDIGDHDHAIPMFGNAMKCYRQAFGNRHPKLALAQGHLGRCQSFKTDVHSGNSNALAGLEMARTFADSETLAVCLMNAARSFEGWGMTATQGVPYVREVIEIRKQRGDNPIALADAFMFLAGALPEAQAAEGEQLARDGLALHAKALPPDHPLLASDVFMLGQKFLSGGKFAEAEVTLKEALQLFRKIHAENHPHRPIVMRLLGEALTKQGKLAELEAAYREEVASYRGQSVAGETMGKLILILHERGEAAEADEMLIQQLAKLKLTLGTNDMAVADFLNRMANQATEQGRFSDAERFAREALDIQLRLDTNNVPQIIASLGGLAATLDNAGKYVDAEVLIQQRLAAERGFYGNEDPKIADTLSWLAWVYSKDKKWAETEAALRDRLAIQRKHFGPGHTNLLDTLDRLFGILNDQGKSSEAEVFLQESLDIRATSFGENHPAAITDRGKLILLLGKQSRSNDVQTQTRKIIALSERTLDAPQPSASNQVREVVATLAGLCDAFERTGKYSLAESFLEQRLALQRRLHGNEDKEVLDSIGWMVQILSKSGRMAEAARLLQQKLEIQRKLHGGEHNDVLASMEWLGNIFEEYGNWSESVAVRQELVAARKRTLGDADPETLRVLASLNSLLVQQGKLVEANTNWPESMELNPQNAAAWLEHAQFLARQGRFKAAATETTKVLEIQSSNHSPYHLLAPLLVAGGDLEGYRRHCERIQAQFLGTQDPLIAERMAKACLIVQIENVDFQNINRWVKIALTADRNDPLFRYSQFVSGLAAYRQSDHARALENAQTVLGLPGMDPNPEIAAWAVMAMVNHGLKQTNEAVTALSKARELAKAKLPKLEAGDLGTGWNDWIITHALLREAGKLIEGTARDADLFSLKK